MCLRHGKTMVKARNIEFESHLHGPYVPNECRPVRLPLPELLPEVFSLLLSLLLSPAACPSARTGTATNSPDDWATKSRCVESAIRIAARNFEPRFCPKSHPVMFHILENCMLRWHVHLHVVCIVYSTVLLWACESCAAIPVSRVKTNANVCRQNILQDGKSSTAE